jgi:hypothetical protein
MEEKYGSYSPASYDTLCCDQHITRHRTRCIEILPDHHNLCKFVPPRPTTRRMDRTPVESDSCQLTLLRNITHQTVS